MDLTQLDEEEENQSGWGPSIQGLRTWALRFNLSAQVLNPWMLEPWFDWLLFCSDLQIIWCLIRTISSQVAANVPGYVGVCASGNFWIVLHVIRATFFGTCVPKRPTMDYVLWGEFVPCILQAFRQVQDQYIQAKLQNSAFEAINEMVRSSSSDCLDMVGQLIPLFIQKLTETFQSGTDSKEAREKQSELQGMLCGKA